MKEHIKVANKGQQEVKAVKQTTEGKKGKVIKGKDLRSGK